MQKRRRTGRTLAFLALSVVLANLATDLVYMIVDPRIRYD